MLTELYTFAEVRDRLRLSDKTLRKLLVSGDLRGARIGRGWRITEEDLEKYIEKQQRRVRASA